MARRIVRLTQIGLVVVVATGLVAAYRFGVFARVADPASFARTLVAMGGWGYLAFVVAYAALQPFGVPGTVFVVAAPLIWPWPIAFALSMVGTTAASVIGFSVARFVARDWIIARVPERFRKYDEALGRNAFRTVFLLRLVFWMPQVLHAFFGVSKVRFWTHFWGSFLGYVPPIFLVSYLGSQIFDAQGHLGPNAWPAIGALVAASLGILVLVRLYDASQRTSRGVPP